MSYRTHREPTEQEAVFAMSRGFRRCPDFLVDQPPRFERSDKVGGHTMVLGYCAGREHEGPVWIAKRWFRSYQAVAPTIEAAFVLAELEQWGE